MKTLTRPSWGGPDRLAAQAAALALAVIAAAPLASAPAGELAAQALTKTVIEAVGADRGVCAVVGADVNLLAQLVPSTQFLVHVREPDGALVAQLRQAAEQLGIGLDRIVLEQGSLAKLPYADNLLDAVVVTRAAADTLKELSPHEVLRVLRPKGTAIVGTSRRDAVEPQRLAGWATKGGGQGAEPVDEVLGTWLRFTKPSLEGADEWSHWEHGPDNNPVSTDEVIKAPYLTQFLAEPWHITMPSITTIAGGRTFLATGHIAHHEREWGVVGKLIGRNGYNGTVLWQRDLPDGYVCHRSAYVATDDVFYLADGDSCLMLDPATGEKINRFWIPGLMGDWKWMAMQDSMLYVMAGPQAGQAKVIKGDRNFGGWSWGDLSEGYYGRPRVPWGFGQKLGAYDMATKQVVWKHEEEAPIDSRALALRDGKLYLYCPDKHVRCLDAGTGSTVWTNTDPDVLRLIEQPGRGLVSTPGFRSSCIAVATPQALVIQGQTRMNVVALATDDGRLLWQKPKHSNNPNAIYLDGNVICGVGQRSNHAVVDPLTGEVREELPFRKVACTRLTACPDSLFVRGEGTLRLDRATKKILIDGAVRPGCNDGALPANGMLYLGPWACDCNLQLIGAMAKCPAGDFRFDQVATEEERLEPGEGDVQNVAPFPASAGDWPTYRGNNNRTSSTTVETAHPNMPEGMPRPPAWRHAPEKSYVPTPPAAAGNLVLVGGSDGKVRALNASNGQPRWTYATNGPIKASPTVWEGRVFVGSGDGYAYCLEAATGRLLWRFRAAPVERLIMVYGNLCSTWPVNTGVLVHEGVAYFAAGIIDSDGTHVYALDARTGKLKWQNNTCGHLNSELRKGVSAQGSLTVLGEELLMAGGNQVTPARFNLSTGECLNQSFRQGQPKANHGKFVGVLFGRYAVAGGRTLYSWPQNAANKDSFVVSNGKQTIPLNFGGIPPAWNDDTLALVNFRDGVLTCCEADKARERIDKGLPPPERPNQPRHWFGLAHTFQGDGAVRWTSDLNQPHKFEVTGLVVAPKSIVALVRYQQFHRAHPEWVLAAFKADDGVPLWFWRYPLPSEPLPEGLLVGSKGQVVVALLDGSVFSFAPQQPPTARRR